MGLMNFTTTIPAWAQPWPIATPLCKTCSLNLSLCLCSFRLLTSVDDILQQHRESNLYSHQLNTYRIRVRRQKLWEDGCEELGRDFDVKKHLHWRNGG